MNRTKKIVSLILLIFFAFPFVYLLLLASTRQWRFPAILPEKLDFKNWEAILNSSSDLSQSLLISVAIAVTVAACSTAIGFLISRTIALHPWRKKLIMACYLPFVLSPVIYALILNYFFILFGLAGSFGGVILAQLVISFPFSLILFNAFWDANIEALEDISYSLGGNFKQTLWKVLLPLAKGQLLVCFFQTFLISWFEYGLTTIIGLGKIHTLTIRVYQYITEANIFYAALGSCIIIFPPLLLLWLNRRFVITKLD